MGLMIQPAIRQQLQARRARGEQLARRIDNRWGSFDAFVTAAQQGDARAQELLALLQNAYHRHKAAEAKANL